MKQKFSSALGAFFMCAWLSLGSAWAQNAFPTPGGSEADGKVLMCPNGTTFQGRQVVVPCGGTGNPVATTAAVSASIGGFIPTPSYASGTTSASDQTVALPNGTEFILTNNGANAMAWNIGAAATGSMNVLQPNSWIAFAGTAAQAFHFIEATGAAGTSTFSLSAGSGLPTGAGGGVAGGSSGSTTSFQSGGTYLNDTNVNLTPTNNPLPAGTNVAITNYGGYKIIYKLSTSGASTVTAPTADGIIQPGCTAVFAVGSNTNIAYATTATGLQSSLQAVGGTGLWTGTSCNNLSVGQDNLTAPSFSTKTGGLDNTGKLQGYGSTAPGVAATNNAMPVQGVTGGIAMPVAAASLPLPTGAATAANQEVTAAGTTATSAQGVQGVTGGVPMNVGCTGSGCASQATNSVPISVSGAATTQLVALSSGKVIQVMQVVALTGGTGTVQFEYGTGSNCGTGTTSLTGAFSLTAQTGLTAGAGLGPGLFVPASNALCMVTTGTPAVAGWVSFAQF